MLKIAEEFNIIVAESTIKCWFWKEGPLRQFYRDYADVMIDLEMEKTRDFISSNVSKAANCLALVMGGQGGPAQVMAAKEFLDRGLGKVTEKREHSGAVGVAMLDVLKAIKNEQGAETNNTEGAK